MLLLRISCTPKSNYSQSRDRDIVWRKQKQNYSYLYVITALSNSWGGMVRPVDAIYCLELPATGFHKDFKFGAEDLFLI